MLELDIVGRSPLSPAEIERLAALAAASAGVADGHLAIEFVDAARIRELNRAYRSKDAPTDVLSFPIDGDEHLVAGPRELGDVVICPEHTSSCARPSSIR